MPVQTWELADTPEGLRSALRLLADLKVVGLDVERADWDRYWRAAALIQVGGDGRVALIDPMALDDLSALDEFLAERLVIFHALENDLGPIASLGVNPPWIADTAVAAAILGLPTGLETLLREQLEVELNSDKQAMQRANWEQRPLSDEMIAYAGGDVADLPALWTMLHDELVAVGRQSWYEEELLATLAQPPSEERRNWARMRSVGRLDPRARARLRALWEAREGLARSTDTAPGRIANDRVLIDLASEPVHAVHELGRRGVRRHAIRQFGPDLVAALAAGERAEPEPVRRLGRAPTEHDRAAVDALRTLRAELATELGIDAGVLCPSKGLMSAVLSDPATPEEFKAAMGLREWQWQQVAPGFLAELGLDGEVADAAGSRQPTLTATASSYHTGVPSMADLLNADAIHHNLAQFPGWAGTTEGISRTYDCGDFPAAIRFVDQVAQVAQDLNHHPDIAINYDKVTLTIVTHSAGGVTQADFVLAEAIDHATGAGNPPLDG